MKFKAVMLMLLFLVLIIIFCSIIFFVIKNPITDYTREDIIELLESGRDYNNYSFCKSDEDNEVIVKFKDNIEVISTKKMTVYINFNEDKQIIIPPKDNIALVSKPLSTSTQNHINDAIWYLKEESWDYRCIGKDMCNGLECVKVRLTQTISSEGYTESWLDMLQKDTEESDVNYIMCTLDFWISLESGLVAKTVLNGESDTGENEMLIYDYKLQLNTVTDDDIKLPDLQDYEVKYIDN